MRYPRFSSFESRLRTYCGWKECADVNELAKSGLFYLGGGDQVQCFDCAIVLHSWKVTDKVDFEHLRHSPSCSFIRSKTTEIYQSSTDLILDILNVVREQNKRIRSLEIELKLIHNKGNEDCVDEIPSSQMISCDGIY